MNSASTATPVESFTPLSPASVTGGRRHRKNLKLVTRKQARKLLKKMGRKMRGGNENDVAGVVAEDKVEGGGRHRRGTKKTHRRGRKAPTMFGLKY